MDMADGTLSPDGKYMWTGSEWIPAPPKDSSKETQNSATALNMQDSVMSGDIVHNTVVNNDAVAVTSAVIEALKQLGVLDQKDPTPAPELPVEEVVLPPSFQVGDHVEYYSPTNNSWLDRCTVTGINSDGTYRVEVPKDTVVETKMAVVIGTTPGSIRPAKPPLEPGDRVLVNWKNYGTYYPGTISKEYDNHILVVRSVIFFTYLITNCFIVSGVIRHWNANEKTTDCDRTSRVWESPVRTTVLSTPQRRRMGEST